MHPQSLSNPCGLTCSQTRPGHFSIQTIPPQVLGTSGPSGPVYLSTPSMLQCTVFRRLGWLETLAFRCALDHGLALSQEAPSPKLIAGHVHWSYCYLQYNRWTQKVKRRQPMQRSWWINMTCRGPSWKPCIENLGTFRITTDNNQLNSRTREFKHNFIY